MDHNSPRVRNTDIEVKAPPPQSPPPSPPPIVPVVIDAANVCWGWFVSHNSLLTAKDTNDRPPADGLCLALEFCARANLDAIAICPRWWLELDSEQRSHMESEDLERYEHLFSTGQLVVSPYYEHDDDFILEYARVTENCFVISNDQYRDHVGKHGITKEWLADRCMAFSFVRQSFVPNSDAMGRIEIIRESMLINEQQQHHHHQQQQQQQQQQQPNQGYSQAVADFQNRPRDGEHRAPTRRTESPRNPQYEHVMRLADPAVGFVVGKQQHLLDVIGAETGTVITLSSIQPDDDSREQQQHRHEQQRQKQQQQQQQQQEPSYEAEQQHYQEQQRLPEQQQSSLGQAAKQHAEDRDQQQPPQQQHQDRQLQQQQQQQQQQERPRHDEQQLEDRQQRQQQYANQHSHEQTHEQQQQQQQQQHQSSQEQGDQRQQHMQVIWDRRHVLIIRGGIREIKRACAKINHRLALLLQRESNLTPAHLGLVQLRVTLPSNSVGAVVGSNGSVRSEIANQTGASVTVSSYSPEQQAVAVATGSRAEVGAAMDFVNCKVHDARVNYNAQVVQNVSSMAIDVVEPHNADPATTTLSQGLSRLGQSMAGLGVNDSHRSSHDLSRANVSVLQYAPKDTPLAPTRMRVNQRNAGDSSGNYSRNRNVSVGGGDNGRIHGGNRHVVSTARNAISSADSAPQYASPDVPTRTNQYHQRQHDRQPQEQRQQYQEQQQQQHQQQQRRQQFQQQEQERLHQQQFQRYQPQHQQQSQQQQPHQHQQQYNQQQHYERHHHHHHQEQQQRYHQQQQPSQERSSNTSSINASIASDMSTSTRNSPQPHTRQLSPSSLQLSANATNQRKHPPISGQHQYNGHVDQPSQSTKTNWAPKDPVSVSRKPNARRSENICSGGILADTNPKTGVSATDVDSREHSDTDVLKAPARRVVYAKGMGGTESKSASEATHQPLSNDNALDASFSSSSSSSSSSLPKPKDAVSVVAVSTRGHSHTDALKAPVRRVVYTKEMGKTEAATSSNQTELQLLPPNGNALKESPSTVHTPATVNWATPDPLLSKAKTVTPNK